VLSARFSFSSPLQCDWIGLLNAIAYTRASNPAGRYVNRIRHLHNVLDLIEQDGIRILIGAVVIMATVFVMSGDSVCHCQE